MCACVFVCVVCMKLYVYIYIYTEREKEKETVNFCSDNEKIATLYLIKSRKFSMSRKYCNLFGIYLRIK